MTFEQTIDANANRIIEGSLSGNGPLTRHLAKRLKYFKDSLTEDNILKDPSQALPPTQIDALARQRLRAEAFSALKEDLKNAAKGKSVDFNIEELPGVVSKVNSVATNLQSGSIIGLITSLPALIKDSIVGDYLYAALMYYAGDKADKNRPKNFDEALMRIKFEKNVGKLAKDLETDPKQLMSQLTAPLTAQSNSQPPNHVADGTIVSPSPVYGPTNGNGRSTSPVSPT